MSTELTVNKTIIELFAQVDMVSPAVVARWGDALPPAKPGENLVAVVMDPWVKAVYSLLRTIQILRDRAKVEAEDFGGTEEEIRQHRLKYFLAEQQSDVLREIFWCCVRTEYGLYGKNLGVRKDWSIVETTSEDDAKDFLRHLLGGLK